VDGARGGGEAGEVKGVLTADGDEGRRPESKEVGG
jgi:hypothetical protein